jgi:hypothetical protein
MSDSKENIRAIYIDLFFFLLILLFGILELNLPDNSSNTQKRPGSIEISIFQSSAIINAGIQINCVPKSWISNKDHFRLLTFDKTQYLESKKIDKKITRLDNLRRIYTRNPNSLIFIHIIPHNSDEIPDLS